MPAEYSRLLDAAIAHLETLKGRGITWVAVHRGTLTSLNVPPPKAGPALLTRSLSPEPGPSHPVPQVASLRSPDTDRPSPAPPVHAPPPSTTARSRWSLAASAAAVTVTASRPLPPPLPPEARPSAMAELRSSTIACCRCPHLVASRQSVVFGSGDTNAKIMFVGEAPGADEDAAGEPFVGLAGQLLTKIITAMGLSRDQVFIANILKCRPDTPGLANGNRKPSAVELAACHPWLERQIDLVSPSVLVALGATAVEGLLGKGVAGITQLRGSWQNHRGIPLMPTFHPAYLLRNQALSEKRKVWEDMLQVLERAGYPVNSRQRGFFQGRG